MLRVVSARFVPIPLVMSYRNNVCFDPKFDGVDREATAGGLSPLWLQGFLFNDEIVRQLHLKFKIL